MFGSFLIIMLSNSPLYASIMILLACDCSLTKWRSGDALEKSLARISSAAPRFGRRNQTNVTRAHQAPSSGVPGVHSPAARPRHLTTFSVALAPKARKNNLKTAPTNQSQKYCPSIIKLTVTSTINASVKRDVTAAPKNSYPQWIPQWYCQNRKFIKDIMINLVGCRRAAPKSSGIMWWCILFCVVNIKMFGVFAANTTGVSHGSKYKLTYVLFTFFISEIINYLL